MAVLLRVAARAAGARHQDNEKRPQCRCALPLLGTLQPSKRWRRSDVDCAGQRQSRRRGPHAPSGKPHLCRGGERPHRLQDARAKAVATLYGHGQLRDSVWCRCDVQTMRLRSPRVLHLVVALGSYSLLKNTTGRTLRGGQAVQRAWPEVRARGAAGACSHKCGQSWPGLRSMAARSSRRHPRMWRACHPSRKPLRARPGRKTNPHRRPTGCSEMT
mmetsp:Transcript_97129/g.243537  ORF Transcript_97129/g.243537 Transcript_97129/m.243537 type:complete len:216 (-) Transcript_97129:2074-2721(-)